MQWVLPSRSARRPSAGRDAWWFAPRDWGPLGSRGKSGQESPHL